MEILRVLSIALCGVYGVKHNVTNKIGLEEEEFRGTVVFP